jgi:autotransporter-associated beta strand protein
MGSKSIGAAVLSLAATSAAFAASSSEADLKLLVYQSKLINPSGAVFVSGHNALVTQKNDGKVLLLKDGKTIGTALDLKVANKGSQGLLDIALSPKFSKDGLVYLFMTPSSTDGGAATSSVVNSYYYSPGLGKLVFRESLVKIPKSATNTNVCGVITFNSKNKPRITQPPPAGNVINTTALTNAGSVGTVKLVHGGLANFGSAAIGLVPSTTIKKFTSGTLTLSSSYGSISLSGANSVKSGQLTLTPITGFNSSIPTNLNGGTFTILPYPSTGTITVNPYPGLGVGTLIGSGQLILTGSNTYTGQTIVGGGTLIVNPINTGTQIISNPGTLVISNPGTITISNPVSTGTLISGASFNFISNGSWTVGTPSTGSLSGGTLSNGTITTQSPAPTSDGQISLVDLGSSPTDLGATGTISLGTGTIDLTTVPTPVVDAATAPIDPASVIADPTVVPAALSLTVVQTPEPGVAALLSSITAGMLLRRRRKI